ncbi:MAG: N-acetylmuramoyl-L-alanine amidase [Acidobacteria bacterium]|nr:N-acetylmuramoyl-L-alanine amidase [Acidobacteriota bacterium]
MDSASRSSGWRNGPASRAAILGALVAHGLWAAAPSRPAVEITAIRFWTLGEATRIAVEISGETKFVQQRLHNPERLFFDLRDARSRLGKRGAQSIPVGDKLLKQIRIAQTQPAVARIVLDLEGDVEFTASQQGTPFRLMNELRPAAKAPKAAAAPAPEPARVAEEKPAPVTPPAPPPPAAVPAKKNSRGERSMTRVLGLKVGRVVIDAGHGGHDHGTTGPSGLTEKELVLDLAQRLGALVQERLSSEVTYTRTDDTFVPLETRTRIANEAKADLFISIHANASPLGSVSGVETYYLNFTTSKADLEVAARENATSQKSIHELTELLEKIARKDKAEESREFAAKVQSAMLGATAGPNSRARNRGVKKAPFVVLIGAAMPSVLVEVGFVSNSREEAQFKKPEYRDRVAEALFKGLSGYAGTLSHFQVAQSKTP